MYVDFKISTWERMQIPEDEETKIQDGLLTGNFTSGDDVYNALGDCNVEFIEGMPSVQMTISENEGECTIELFNNNNERIWNNKTIKL